MTFNWHYILNATNSCMAPLTSFCTWLSIFICCTFTLAITNHKRLEAGVKKAVIMGFSWDDRICVKSIKYWLTKNVFYSRASCSEKMAAVQCQCLWAVDIFWCRVMCIRVHKPFTKTQDAKQIWPHPSFAMLLVYIPRKTPLSVLRFRNVDEHLYLWCVDKM